MTLFLVAGCSGKLDRDAQDFEGYPAPRSSAAPPSLSSIYPSGILGNPYISPDEESKEANIGYKTQGNLRKSFSYVQTKRPRAKARYEALRSNINEPLNTYDLQNKTSFEKQKDENRGHDSYSTTTEKTKSEVDETSTKRSISGPNVEGQQPYRHWSTESNVIREEHPDGLYQSYPYVTPAYSTQEPEYSWGNINKAVEVSTEGYNQDTVNKQKQLFKPNINYDHLAIIPATTYRPATRDSYTFSFASKNHSRHETGDTSGNFRGSIKYVNTHGGSKQIDYEGNPRIGITTSERTPVVNIPARSGQRYITPSTSRPFMTTRNGLTYSYSSPATGYQYSPTRSSTTQAPFSSTPQSQIPYRRGKTVYQPPQFYLQPVQTYDYLAPSIGDSYMYYTESPQYVQLSPEYGAYTFTYNAGDHERTESRDNQGNVHGMFSFEGTDGERKQVTYEANSEKGFVARGQHLPVQTKDLTGSQGTYQQSTQSTGNEPSSGTYFFSYNAGEHMREERKDEQGNIHGMYRYMAGDGKMKTVKYRASPSEGFVATGDDIPNAQNGYSYSYTIGNQPQTGLRNRYQPDSLSR